MSWPRGRKHKDRAIAVFLVTGGCGFIGSALVAALRHQGDTVRVLDDLSSGRRPDLPKGVELIRDGTSNQAALEEAFAGVDACFHFSAPPRLVDDPRKSLTLDDSGFADHAAAIFDSAVRANPGAPVPVIYASSAAVYGTTSDAPIPETAPTKPVNAHGAEKLAFERTAQRFARTHGVRSWGLRMFNVYGERQSPASMYCSSVRLFAERVLQGEDLVIYGDGTQKRDFVHVDDAVACIVLAAVHIPDGAGVLNVCTGVGTRINEAADLLLALSCSSRAVVRQEGRAADVPFSVGDPVEARRRLGFECRIGLETGMTRMLRVLAKAENRMAEDRSPN